jgi:hypothetical protein
MKKLILLFTLIAVFFSQSVASPNKNYFVIQLKKAPIFIESSSFNVKIKSGLGITTVYKSVSQKKITALSVGFLFFDPFNRFLSAKSGLDLRDQRTADGNQDNLDPDESVISNWEFDFLSDFSTISMITFINKVRFDDGTIWEADPKELDVEFQKLIGSGFDPTIFK